MSLCCSCPLCPPLTLSSVPQPWNAPQPPTFGRRDCEAPIVLVGQGGVRCVAASCASAADGATRPLLVVGPNAWWPLASAMAESFPGARASGSFAWLVCIKRRRETLSGSSGRLTSWVAQTRATRCREGSLPTTMRGHRTFAIATLEKPPTLCHIRPACRSAVGGVHVSPSSTAKDVPS